MGPRPFEFQLSSLLKQLRDTYPRNTREYRTLDAVVDWAVIDEHFDGAVSRLVKGMRDGSVFRRPLRSSRRGDDVLDTVELDAAGREEAQDA